MLKKNELKNLIYIQENSQCNEQTVKGLFRSIVEPILESSVENIVMLRLEDKSKKDFDSIIKRLGFSCAKVYDFSDESLSEKFENVLKEKIWDKTEFIYVLSERFGASFIFDYEEAEMDGFAAYYIMHNSKKLTKVFELINDNSTIDLSEYDAKWHPDRRENELLNSSIRKLVDNLNETNQEVMISELEKEQIAKNDKASEQLEYITTKSSYVAHEMKNLLAICNLYSEIIKKNSGNIAYNTSETEKAVKNALCCIDKSVQMAVNMLLDFRSIRKSEIKEYSLKELLNSAINLSRIYAGEEIQIVCETVNDVTILADENKFLAVVINLIKNAIESIEGEGKIEISTKQVEENVKIKISNSGTPLSEDLKSKIFEAGFTTKKGGNGLGLQICRKTMEEQYGKLELIKSDEKSTDFEITVLKG